MNLCNKVLMIFFVMNSLSLICLGWVFEDKVLLLILGSAKLVSVFTTYMVLVLKKGLDDSKHGYEVWHLSTWHDSTNKAKPAYFRSLRV